MGPNIGMNSYFFYINVCLKNAVNDLKLNQLCCILCNYIKKTCLSQWSIYIEKNNNYQLIFNYTAVNIEEK